MADATPARLVVCDGAAPPPAGDDDPGQRRRDEHRRDARRRDEAVDRVVHARLGAAAALLLAVAFALTAWKLAILGTGLAGASTTASTALGLTACTALAAAGGWQSRRGVARRAANRSLAAAATAALALVAWPSTTLSASTAWPAVAASVGTVALGGMWAIGAAALLHPDRAAAQVPALLPALLGAAALAAPSATAARTGVADSMAMAATALAAALAALGCAATLHRGWRDALDERLQTDGRLERAARERDEARRSGDERSRFLAVASHDLRQPVHALGLFAATLQRRLEQGPDGPLADNLLRSVEAMERSFNAVLDISKLDAGALSPRLETFALRDLFRRLQMQYAGQAELAGLGLRFAPGGRSVTSDPALLERIVGNLVHNAIKYTARGGVVVVARGAAHATHIEVWDSGPGIAGDELPRIFDEFYRIDGEPAGDDGTGFAHDRSQGLGMGLAIVKRLALLLGHRLEVASSLGRGTMFRVGVAVGAMGALGEAFAPADTRPLPMPLPTLRTVLVVDDDEPIREGLRLLLREWGLQAITAAGSVQAEHALEALDGRVDLILTDLHLGAGGADGRTMLGALRRRAGRDVPAILITGDAAQAAGTGTEAGAGKDPGTATGAGDPLLLKPVQPRRLFEAVRAALGD